MVCKYILFDNILTEPEIFFCSQLNGFKYFWEEFD